MRNSTWTSIGQDVRTCKSLEQVLKASNLGYKVEKRPVYMNAGPVDMTEAMTAIPNRFVTVRDADGHPYDIVSDKFEIIQNKDAFDFVNYMSDELEFEKAGETKSGMVYIIGKLPSMDILGDTFTPHVIFRNGFSGKIKISAAICPLRVVCQNQFNFAFKDAENTINIRHVQNAERKLEEAREVLKVSADYMKKLGREAKMYSKIHITEFGLERALNKLFPMENLETMNAYKRARLEGAREAFKKAYNADDNQNFKGTAWGLINAYTDYLTHKDAQGKPEVRDESKFMAVTFKPMNDIFSVIEYAA